MVRALLDGSKTQTRRVMKPQPIADSRFSGGYSIAPTKRTEGATLSVEAPYVALACPYGQPGDRLWVRETFTATPDRQTILYRADPLFTDMPKDDLGRDWDWSPSIHMPRWASRITLKIVSVRVEQLQDISEADSISEGCTKNHNGYFWAGPQKAGGLKQMATATDAYRDLWESINGAGSWEANPWVWFVEFRKA